MFFTKNCSDYRSNMIIHQTKHESKSQMNKERWTQFATVEKFKLQHRRKIEKSISVWNYHLKTQS